LGKSFFKKSLLLMFELLGEERKEGKEGKKREIR